MFQEFLIALYGPLDDDIVVDSFINYNLQKSDLILTVQQQRKRISIKKGVKNSVHVEPLPQFIRFLRENNVDEKTVTALLSYHYADGTIDGSGRVRQSSEEYKKDHQSEIDQMNEVFNQEELLRKVIDRFILVGNNSKDEVDAILYGVTDDFIWMTKEETREVILSYRNLPATGVHFGPLFYQPLNRCLNYNSKLEATRHKIQIKWYHLSDAIIEVMNKRMKNLEETAF